MHDLKSLRILVTRPEPQASELSYLIQQQGGIAINFPTIAFAPPTDEALFQQSIEQLGEQDWIIFNSPQAVYASVPVIRRRWPQFPEKVQFAAVGAGTAKALRQAGYHALYPAQHWSSEGLLAMEPFRAVASKKIAIIRGEHGREYLETNLIKRGALVLSVIAYRRVLPTFDNNDYLYLFTERLIDRIICTSYESLRNLRILIGEQAWSDVKQIPLIVISERIKILAQSLGFQTIWVTSQASNESIVALLASKESKK